MPTRLQKMARTCGRFLQRAERERAGVSEMGDAPAACSTKNSTGAAMGASSWRWIFAIDAGFAIGRAGERTAPAAQVRLKKRGESERVWAWRKIWAASCAISFSHSSAQSSSSTRPRLTRRRCATLAIRLTPSPCNGAMLLRSRQFAARSACAQRRCMFRPCAGTSPAAPVGASAIKRNALSVERCWMLGYFGRDCADHNRADACAAFDYACAIFCRRSFGQERLVMLGEVAGGGR